LIPLLFSIARKPRARERNPKREKEESEMIISAK
jgi:hypothetical protein